LVVSLLTFSLSKVFGLFFDRLGRVWPVVCEEGKSTRCALWGRVRASSDTCSCVVVLSVCVCAGQRRSFAAMPPKRRHELSEGQRGMVVGMHKAGKSLRDIAKSMRISLSTAKYTIRRFRETGRFVSRPRSGRPKVVTAKTKRLIRRTIRTKTHGSLRLTQAKLRLQSIHLSLGTISNVVHEGGLRPYRPRAKPVLSAESRRLRLEWARARMKDSAQRVFRFVFSDEKYFVVGPRNRLYWLRPDEPRPVCEVGTSPLHTMHTRPGLKLLHHSLSTTAKSYHSIAFPLSAAFCLVRCSSVIFDAFFPNCVLLSRRVPH
jgi:transposase